MVFSTSPREWGNLYSRILDYHSLILIFFTQMLLMMFVQTKIDSDGIEMGYQSKIYISAFDLSKSINDKK